MKLMIIIQILIIMLLSPLIIQIFASAEKTSFQPESTEINSTSTYDESNAMDGKNNLISLLDYLGVDLSYGNQGETIFSMVEDSLNRIIISLSSGNLEGFMKIPLIQETMSYFGISENEIVISPYNESEPMDAVDNYIQKFQSKNPL